MQWPLVIFSFALLLSSCRPALERKLVGAWSGCSIDICSVTTLRPDHSFSERFVGFDTDSYSGSWRVEREQLVLHIAWADENLKDMLGKDMRLIISDLQNHKLVATLADDKKKALPWTRVQ
jgi:hypothetical protein